MELTKVLLIEDDEPFVFLVERILGKGYEIQCCPTLANGLEVVKENGVDVILLDLSLPDSANADDTLRRFFEFRLDVAVLILSNHSDPGLLMRALSVGAQGYLIKGKINSDWLRAAVFQAILIRQFQRRHRDQLMLVFKELYNAWEEESVRLYQTAAGVTDPGAANLVFESAEKISDRLARLARQIAPKLIQPP